MARPTAPYKTRAVTMRVPDQDPAYLALLQRRPAMNIQQALDLLVRDWHAGLLSAQAVPLPEAEPEQREDDAGAKAVADTWV